MEEASLTRAYQESVHPLYEYVSRRCGGDRSLPEDVVQEAWLRAVVAWEKNERTASAANLYVFAIRPPLRP